MRVERVERMQLVNMGALQLSLLTALLAVSLFSGSHQAPQAVVFLPQLNYGPVGRLGGGLWSARTVTRITTTTTTLTYTYSTTCSRRVQNQCAGAQVPFAANFARSLLDVDDEAESISPSKVVNRYELGHTM